MTAVTIRDILQDAARRFEPVSESPRLDAQLLIAETLGVSRAHVLAHPERTLTPEETQQIHTWIDRRATGEPIAYILGRRAFYDRELIVTPDVLIPRPETEHLLEAALDFAAGRSLTAVDVGTGSGALAVTFRALNPAADVFAVDISEAALAVAQHNAERQGVAITFLQGDLLEPIIAQGLAVDLVMANLPYIDQKTLNTLDVARHEPWHALNGGTDGLEVFRRFMPQARQVCTPYACILLEIGADQGEAVPQIARQHFPRAAIHVSQDLAGLDRLVHIMVEA